MSNINSTGTVTTANGIKVLNNVANVDPRKATIFSSRQDALDSIDNSLVFQRVEGLSLLVTEGNKIVQYIFDGGILDENFMLFSGTSDLKSVRLSLFALGIPVNSNILNLAATLINIQKPLPVVEKGVIPFINVIVSAEEKIYILTFKDKNLDGSYGPTGNEIVSASDLQIVGERILNLSNLTDPTTDRIDLGDIEGSEVWDFVGDLNPAVDVQSETDGYTIFKAIQQGVSKAWFYVGETGLVGLNNYQPSQEDFNEIAVEGGVVKEQIISSGGNYNNLDLTGNTLHFTNNNAQAIVNGFDSSKYKRVTLINNSSFDVRLNAEDTNSDENKRIKLPTGLTNMGIQGTTELVYINSIERWQIVDSFASKYRPEHRGLDEFEVEVVGPNAISETREIIELIVFRDAQVTDLTLADLDTLYPDERRGFHVICPLINKTYIKENENTNPNTWHYINHNNVPTGA